MALCNQKQELASPSSFAPGIFRIFLGAGFGLLSRRLLINARHAYHSRVASLAAAPTLPLSSLNSHPIPDQGQLVLLRNGFVSPLSERLLSSSGREAVLVKTVAYTDQPEQFDGVFDGTRSKNISRVPFTLTSNRDGGGFRVAVVNADEKHLPLELDLSVTSALDPPVSLTCKRVTRTRFFLDKIEKSASIVVNKVTEQSVLGVGTRLENVFGRLKSGSSNGGLGLGFPEIEPCPSFPDICFAMSKSKIKRKLFLDSIPTVTLSLLAGLLSLGFLFSGIRCILFNCAI